MLSSSLQVLASFSAFLHPSFPLSLCSLGPPQHPFLLKDSGTPQESARQSAEDDPIEEPQDHSLSDTHRDTGIGTDAGTGTGGGSGAGAGKSNAQQFKEHGAPGRSRSSFQDSFAVEASQQGLHGSYAVITSGDSTGTAVGADAGARGREDVGTRGVSAGVPGPQWRQDLREDDISRDLSRGNSFVEDDRLMLGSIAAGAWHGVASEFSDLSIKVSLSDCAVSIWFLHQKCTEDCCGLSTRGCLAWGAL